MGRAALAAVATGADAAQIPGSLQKPLDLLRRGIQSHSQILHGVNSALCEQHQQFRLATPRLQEQRLRRGNVGNQELSQIGRLPRR